MANDGPWRGDARSLVGDYRAGERTPVEELEAILAAIEGSTLNGFCLIDAEDALADDLSHHVRTLSRTHAKTTAQEHTQPNWGPELGL